jgi:2'-5' RNA ligase
MRLFIALEVPEAWRREADRLGLVDPALMHLTLRFLGEVDEDLVPALQDALERETPPLDLALSLAPAGTFGPPHRTSIAWLGVSGDLEALQALAANVERAVVECGLPGEERPLRPHLTLARLHQAATPDQRRAVAEAVGALEPPAPAPYRPTEVVLVHSHLGGSQPRYEVLSRHGAGDRRERGSGSADSHGERG